MDERQMEDLLAKYPDDFFPRKVLTLKGRQQSFAGVGRFDLLFQDEHQTNILIELKARPAKYPDADQLAKYKGALEEKGVEDVLMWLVAPQIPTAVRQFLDRMGIEYTEIHEAEFRQVAARNGIDLDGKPGTLPAPGMVGAANAPYDSPSSASTSLRTPQPTNVAYELKHDFDRGELTGLLTEFRRVAKRRIDASLANHLEEELLRREPPRIELRTLKQLARWCKTDGGVYSDGMDVARRISQLLFGSIIDREALGT